MSSKINNITIEASDDGDTHINIYSGGKTNIGKFLSNFTYSPVDTDPYGAFDSIEGLYHYNKLFRSLARAGVDHTKYDLDSLRSLSGWKAQVQGRHLRSELIKGKVFIVDTPDEYDNDLIEKAICDKILSIQVHNNDFYNSIVYCNKPFVHYYVVQDRKIIHHKHFDWLPARVNAAISKLQE